jgi:uncharacterized RDD family membrane protein YckC
MITGQMTGRAPPVAAAGPWRRILAFALDYLLTSAYLLVLAALSVLILSTPLAAGFRALWANALGAEVSGFFLLTLPVVLYFALFESSSRQATWGKRVLGLRVVDQSGERLALPHSLLRSAIKFLPWEIAHFTIWHFVFAASRRASPPVWTVVALTVVYLLAGAYVLFLFIGRHRTPYDRAAGSYVVGS